MKQYLVIIALMLLSVKSWAQDGMNKKTIMAEQYCQVMAVSTGGLFEVFKVNIDVDYGEAVNKRKDMRVKDSSDVFRTFNTIVDALNYMGRHGWSLVNAFSTNTKGNTDNITYLFKKIVAVSELKGEK